MRRWTRNEIRSGRRRILAAALIVLGPVVTGFGQSADGPARPVAPRPLDGPLSPEEAPSSFKLEPGLRLEMVAAEPLTASPVAMAFDERGRLYVAENRGYPTGPGEPPVGRIAMLEDTDGDGRMDRRTEFARGLTYPNGVMPWKGGLIITCAPDVLLDSGDHNMTRQAALGTLTLWFLPGEFDDALPRVRQLAYNR
jgi:glucose/arabinose dehydrogenase